MPFTSSAYRVSLAPAERDRLDQNNVDLGYHPDTGDAFLLPDQDRYAGVYMLGVQGVGKSGLLERMVAHDANVGNALVVIDPHGDLADHCLAALPAERVVNTYLLDVLDEAYPFGVNVFAVGPLTTDAARAQAVGRIMHIFEVLWPEVLSQAHLPRYVRAAIITLLANPGATLVDMHALLIEPQARQRMLRQVKDPTVRAFWRAHDDLSKADQQRRVQPLLTRLEALFMGRSLVRNIVGQRATSVNFRQAIENREAIFIKLPVKMMPQDARLIGTILLAQIHAAIFSFADMPESQRPGVSLYVDEVQHFATPDFAELFSEGRKFGAKVTLAHQYRGQLPEYLQQSTTTARSKVCFQLTPEDGREMAHFFPSADTTIKPEDLDPRPVDHLLAYGSDNYFVSMFLDAYVRPLPVFKRGNKVDIEKQVFVLDFWRGSRFQHVYVEDPLPYLNHLLYEVMKTGNPDLDIPEKAVFGFANSGKNFIGPARRCGDQDLSRFVQYPQGLVVNNRWTRAPENAWEQFYHFVFHLRRMMHHLAQHPIGKVTTTTPAAVGQMLTQLPRRAAFIRSAEDVGVIFTHNTPSARTGSAHVDVLTQVRNQTRVKYCHPRDQVEQQFTVRDTQVLPTVEPNEEDEPPQWEDVP